ncbi:hypothetical protein GA0070607_4470 [Micromonospora coriariae]|uniref:Uncharacterized protein n=1 Tax=Micromonospora coriariae TaxID=285665 RepID=A0A1C4WZP6_9ACTN|nr:hypothetical protein [Micromonospora coriariae]SCF01727.1 hypothetical protein GA0070607_4470 [Micromonospora coriariae]
MSEYDDEQLVDRAFASFTSDPGAVVQAPGGVRDTVSQRRRMRVTTVLVSAGLATVLPLGVFMGTGRGQPDTTGASANATASATAGPSTPAASPSPTPTPTPTPTAAPTTSAPPDRSISLAQLTAAPVGVPKWPWSGSTEVDCTSGRVTLRPTAQVSGARVGVVDLLRTNLDDDPEAETAALLRCGYGAEQVMAFDRDDHGTIITLGQVVATDLLTQAIVKITARSRGGVTATVADTRARDDQRRQDRSFAWNGSWFAQVGGPTGFPPRVRAADLGLTVATPLAAPVSGPCEGKYRKMSVIFTVINHSTETSGRFHLEWRGGIDLPNGTYDSPYWLDTPGDPAENSGYRGLKRGESVQLTYSFMTDACLNKFGFTTDIRSNTPDPDESNNHVLGWVRTQ